MITEQVHVISNQQIANETYEMILQAEMATKMKPGQFVNLKIEGLLLRRPISICQYDQFNHTFTIIYKVVGDGTKKLTALKPGDTLDCMGPLGSHFPIEAQTTALVVGGGVGVPPLYETTKQLIAAQTKVTVVLGFADAQSAFYVEAFEQLGASVYVATDNGTLGTQGRVTNVIAAENLQAEYVYACGPEAMLRALETRFDKGYLSFEARMACGIGACMACVCKDREDTDLYYRICKEGPVFPVGKVGF
ncbi:MAG: dihydroorotate dehydrogenase electron transfer subunit [Culicoidibacterales bacterium]